MTEKPHYIGHRERLRERFRKSGSEGFHDYELLELLLTYGLPRRDVKPIAKALIKRFGSFSGVLDASERELLEVVGMGPISSILIKLVKDLCCLYLEEKMKGRDVLSSPKAVVDFVKMRLSGLPYEAFMVIYLNTKNEVLHYEIIQEGTIDRAVVFPRRIIEGALAQHASGLILVHNHPSGHNSPSEDDKNLTRSIILAAKTLDLRILDHIVVGKEGHFSFMENRLLPLP
ncbi:MAG: RadC family protein [Thermodesulfobacteriota bacterium]